MKIKPTIKDLPLEERPRERLVHYGPEQLAAAELLGIILRTGSARKTAVAIGEELLAHFGDLRGLSRASIAEMAKCHGIGAAKAVQLKAAFELGRRIVSASPARLPAIRKPQDVFELLRTTFQGLDREHFKAVHLNVKNQVIKVETVTIGILSSSPVHPREVFKEAVRMSSAGLVMAHNHPSGDPSPSQDDLLLTERLRQAGEILGIQVIDHVIFGDNSYVSLKERGHLV